MESPVFISLLFIFVVAASNGIHNRKVKITTPCGAAHYLRELGSTAKGELVAASSKAATALETATKIRLVGQAKGGTVACAANLIATSSKLKQTIAKALGGEKGLYEDTETKTKVDHFLKQTVGMDGEKAENDLVKDLSQLTPLKEAVGGDGTRKLQDISAPQDLANAKTLYAVRKFVVEEQKNKNQASPSCPSKADKSEEPPKTADECKKHKTSEYCKKKTGCNFDDKKDPKRFPKVDTEKKDEKSFSENLRVFIPHVFSALVLSAL
uniref:Variant surface glycoprotein 1125.5662 n=1 Tax=Trypanosoma brucei TaxID=5691 RepID=A0A1J0RD46_9TRYP|nr:variant surface glycoprotein 1125.5662 [Trypanosoma brucei]